MNPSIRDIIENQTIFGVGPEASVFQAAVLMTTHRVGALAVMGEAGLVGIFTERDLVSRVIASRLDPELTPVRQVMTENPKTITSDQTPCDALNLMHAHGFRHLPVVDGERLMAMLSMRDIPTKYRFMREKWIEMRHGTMMPSI
ncbi:MAG: CBS domain-containing protein [Candidatus Competibacter sp.]|nr:CBS domain-containing protein [Candidatus Competibacter sp.]